MSMNANRFVRNRKRSAREQAKLDADHERRIRLCFLYEDTYRAWSAGRSTKIEYKDGYYLVGKARHKMRETKLLEAIAAMEKDAEMQQHMASLSASMEAGTGEDALPGGEGRA